MVRLFCPVSLNNMLLSVNQYGEFIPLTCLLQLKEFSDETHMIIEEGLLDHVSPFFENKQIHVLTNSKINQKNVNCFSNLSHIKDLAKDYPCVLIPSNIETLEYCLNVDSCDKVLINRSFQYMEQGKHLTKIFENHLYDKEILITKHMEDEDMENDWKIEHITTIYDMTSEGDSE